MSNFVQDFAKTYKDDGDSAVHLKLIDGTEMVANVLSIGEDFLVVAHVSGERKIPATAIVWWANATSSGFVKK